MKSLALPAHFGSASREARTRLPRGPLIVMGLGAALMLGHGFVQDYAQALAAPDGLYIPNARQSLSSNMTAGTYSHTFRLYNARPHWVTVTANPDCGCTNISWKEATLPPFGWKNLTMEMPVSPSKATSVSTAFRFKDSPVSYLFATIQTSSP